MALGSHNNVHLGLYAIPVLKTEPKPETNGTNTHALATVALVISFSTLVYIHRQRRRVHYQEVREYYEEQMR